MKKVLSFVGCALFVAAMAVSCGSNNEESTDTIDSVTTIEEPATEKESAPVEVTAIVDNTAMLDAARQAGQAKCNCYNTDPTSVENCINAILAESYAAYKDNADFQKTMNDEFNKCVKSKVNAAAKDAAQKGIKAGANALSKELTKNK